MIYFFAQTDTLGPAWEALLDNVLHDDAIDRVHLCFREQAFEAMRMAWTARYHCENTVTLYPGNVFLGFSTSAAEQLRRAGAPSLFLSNDQRLNQALIEGGIFDPAPLADGRLPDLLIATIDGDDVHATVHDIGDLMKGALNADEAITKVLTLTDDRRSLSHEDGDDIALTLQGDPPQEHLLFRGRIYRDTWMKELMQRLGALSFDDYARARDKVDSGARAQNNDMINRARHVLFFGSNKTAQNTNDLARLRLRTYRKSLSKLHDDEHVLLVPRTAERPWQVATQCLFLCDQTAVVDSIEQVSPSMLRDRPAVVVSGAELKRRPGIAFAAAMLSDRSYGDALAIVLAPLLELAFCPRSRPTGDRVQTAAPET